MNDELDLEELYLFVTALRRGDFSRRLSETGPGRAQEIALHLNRFSEQMQHFTSEVVRISREIGEEGRLGPQIDSVLPTGPWKNCLEAVNDLAARITDQIRDFNRTADLLSQGTGTRKVTVPCEGEFLQLKQSLNRIVAGSEEATN